MGFRNFLTELRRRRVWLVGGVYIISAWVVAQVASLALPTFSAPSWVMPVLFIVLGLGLPLAIILAWAQETQAGADEKAAKPANQTTSEKPGIAVLPFDNLSGDEQYGYLADGLVEEVITVLAQNPRFRVIARNSSFTYKGEAVDVRAVGRELNVGYVVEGSVRKIGPQMRINVQLIEAETGAHVWSDRYSIDAEEIFDVQDKVIVGIAASLGDELMAAEKTRHGRRPTEDLGAWELYARVGNYRTYSHPDEPERLLREALAKDPEFAEAMALLASLIGNRAQFEATTPERLAEAKQLADRALEIALNDPLVMGFAASAYCFLGDLDLALQIGEASVARAEGSLIGWTSLATNYVFRGESEKALEMIDRATELSPRTLARSGFLGLAATAQMQLGNLEAALAMSDDALRYSTNWWTNATGMYQRINILGLMGRDEEARNLYSRLRREKPKFDPADTQDFWARTYMPEPGALMIEGITKAGIED